MKVLRKEELGVLLQVPTSPAFANNIKARFGNALKHLDKLPKVPKRGVTYTFDVETHCPHCILLTDGDFDCEACGYAKVSPKLPELATAYGILVYCTAVTFGGISYRMLNGNEYYARPYALLDLTLCAENIHFMFELLETGMEGARRYQRFVQDVRTWCRGHVEWADFVLRAARHEHAPLECPECGEWCVPRRENKNGSAQYRCCRLTNHADLRERHFSISADGEVRW